MRDAMAAVQADMRNPVLPFVSGTINRRNLPLVRLQSRVRTPSGRGVTVTKRCVGDSRIPVLVTTPIDGQRQRPGVLWLHGGGYILGSPQMEVFGTGRLARDLGVVAVSPDYRLAPERPFPAALDDRMTTLGWMRAHAEELGIDQDRIAVMGASAGDLDLFYDEDVDYAEKLRASGVPCELVTVPGMYHGADGLARKSLVLQDFRRSMTEHLRTHLVSSD
jgi:acetyl esterase/lipase